MNYELKKPNAVFFEVSFCHFVILGHEKAAHFTTNYDAFIYHLC